MMAEEFRAEVLAAPLAGNVDEPEGALDALMQVMVCTDRLGWRRDSRKIIMLATDQVKTRRINIMNLRPKNFLTKSKLYVPVILPLYLPLLIPGLPLCPGREAGRRADTQRRPLPPERDVRRARLLRPLGRLRLSVRVSDRRGRPHQRLCRHLRCSPALQRCLGGALRPGGGVVRGDPGGERREHRGAHRGQVSEDLHQNLQLMYYI